MFLSLSIVYQGLRHQIGFGINRPPLRFLLVELPLPAARNTPHRPRQVPHEIDLFVPVSALPCGPRPYQCPKLGFAKQVFPSPAACGPSETLNPVVSESLETQQL